MPLSFVHPVHRATHRIGLYLDKLDEPALTQGEVHILAMLARSGPAKVAELRDYNAGERVIGPPGVPHAWRNRSDQAILCLVSEHRPVLHMELMLEAGSRIARDFSNNKKALPKHLLRAAVVLSEIRSDFYFTSWSLRAMMAALVALAPAGRWLGYQADGR